MTSGSLGIRSPSYGSLQQFQNGGVGLPPPINPPAPPIPSRKASKMLLHRAQENVFMWIFKFAHRKRIGMLLLFLVSSVAMLWILYVGKGEEATQQVDPILRSGFNNNSVVRFSESSPANADEKTNHKSNFDNTKVKVNDKKKITARYPPPPVYFTGYKLPPGNPCETFTLPPPPADKKKTGPRPCPVCYLPVEEAVALMPKAPSFSPVLQKLTYVHDENPTRSKRKTEFGGSEFGGYPSLKQRLESYNVRKSMAVHCGFVRGRKPGRKTGFDVDDSDLSDMDRCRGVVVASAIFGAYDLIQEPKNISAAAKKNVCFFMFVDEETEKFMRDSNDLDDGKKVGLWRIVVVRDLPYTDPRRNGKVPKLLLHRPFPNARYSLWIDGKLELVVDPYQILERFLWRKNVSFAISRHYKRFDVFVEAEANKAARKYDNASIDFQIDFYKKEGLTPYSKAKLPITSDVPEGCVVIREHVPVSNLFTCLWFNEVDRFTSRDQISFSTVRDKIRTKTNWTVDMFLDCERRNFVVQGYHRDVLEHWAPPPPPGGAHAVFHPPSPLNPIDQARKKSSKISTESSTKTSAKRRKDKKSGSKRHRKVAAGKRDATSQSQN